MYFYKKHLLLLVTILPILIFLSCTKTTKTSSIKSKNTIKSAYQNNFYIGTALNVNQINEVDSVQKKLIPREFNAITAENVMKSILIHPTQDEYNFKLSDKFVALGEKYNYFVHGHTLIWHSQLSPFFREIKDRSEMISAMTNHINTIVSRYKGKIHSWDVLNEALNDDGTLRKTPFLEALGEEYIALSFNLAAKADPDAKLYYNDYSMTNSKKRKGAINMIRKLQAQGVKIDGIGMQGHWNLTTPTIKEIEESILAYASLGIKVSITELDVSVIPMPWDFSGADVNVKFESTDSTMNPYPKSLPDSINTKLANRYKDIFNLFLKYQDKIERVTIWGVNDNNSWKNDWPIPGRTDYPLLFDRNNKRKLAYDKILALKECDSLVK